MNDLTAHDIKHPAVRLIVKIVEVIHYFVTEHILKIFSLCAFCVHETRAGLYDIVYCLSHTAG